MRNARGVRHAMFLVLTTLVVGCPGMLLAHEIMVDGETARERVDKVMTKIAWHQDLEEAFAASREQGKMVLWLQVVGELDDGL